MAKKKTKRKSVVKATPKKVEKKLPTSPVIAGENLASSFVEKVWKW